MLSEAKHLAVGTVLARGHDEILRPRKGAQNDKLRQMCHFLQAHPRQPQAALHRRRINLLRRASLVS